MKEQVKPISVHEAVNGQVFSSREYAIDYEKSLKCSQECVKPYEVQKSSQSSLNASENSVDGHILVCAKGNHSLFAKYWCFKKLKNNKGFISDINSSGNLKDILSLKEVPVEGIEKCCDSKILARIVNYRGRKLIGHTTIIT